MKTMTPRPPAPAPAQKLFYRINEVAQMTGLKAYVLRYWETEFRELAPAKDASDQRRYRPADIETVLTIRKLLYEDRFTIEGARKRLRDELRMRRQGGTMADSESAHSSPARREMRAATNGHDAHGEKNAHVANEGTGAHGGNGGHGAPMGSAGHRRSASPRLDLSILRLRMEVNELINMLR